MSQYIKLLRVNHYIKNFLIFLPLIFSGNLLNFDMLVIAITGVLSFSIMSSSIYIFNDLCDYEKDKLHPKKKLRPIASGAVSKRNATILFVMFIFISIAIPVLLYFCGIIAKKMCIVSCLILCIYLIINVLYSTYIKNVAILDILFLAFGFVLRVYFGGSILNIEISEWLYLTVLCFSLYLGLGKRRGELTRNKDKSRPVLKYYTKDYLDKLMNLFLTLTLVFYSLWCTNITNVNGQGGGGN